MKAYAKPLAGIGSFIRFRTCGFMRQDLRQKPYAVTPLVRIPRGGRWATIVPTAPAFAAHHQPDRAAAVGVRRRVKTQGAQPSETAVLRLLRRIKGFRELEEKHEEAA